MSKVEVEGNCVDCPFYHSGGGYDDDCWLDESCYPQVFPISGYKVVGFPDNCPLRSGSVEVFLSPAKKKE